MTQTQIPVTPRGQRDVHSERWCKQVCRPFEALFYILQRPTILRPLLSIRVNHKSLCVA